MATAAEELHHLIDALTPDEQEQMLHYARELTQHHSWPRTPLPPGTPGSMIAHLRVSPEGGEAMEQALEECERIDPDEWE